MTTENSTETLVVKTRKPRSPNKPKTLDKQVELANKFLNRLVGKQQAAVELAEQRVKDRFSDKRQEFFLSLSDEVRAGVDPDFELVVTNGPGIVTPEEAEVAAE